MVLAAIFHPHRTGETRSTMTNLILAAVAFLLTYGRIVVSPF